MSAADIGAATPPDPRRRRAGRLIDVIGPAAFPLVYFTTHDFGAATWATTVGSLVAVVLRWRLDRRLAPISAITGLVAIVTGLLAAVFGAKAVLQEKPTLVHGLIGLGLVVAWLLGGRPAKAVLGGAIHLEDRTWATLCLRFGLFAFAMAIMNEMIRRYAPTELWALFHFPGQLLAHLLFLATQLPLIFASRRRVQDEPAP